MFLSLIQAQGNINIDPEQMRQIQDQLNNLNNLTANPAAQQAVKTGFMFAGWMMGLMFLIGIVALVLTVINLINIYHWGMTDKAVFENAKEDKKKWFINLLLVPIIASLVMIIPFLGWVAGPIIYIYWLVISLTYFFSTRKKLV